MFRECFSRKNSSLFNILTPLSSPLSKRGEGLPAFNRLPSFVKEGLRELLYDIFQTNMNQATTLLIQFILFVPTIVFFTDVTRNPYFFQIVLLNASTVLLWMWWLWQGRAKGELSVKRTPVDIPLWVFFAVATISWAVALATDYGESYIRYSVYSEGLKRWLYTLVNCIMPMYAAMYFSDEKTRPRYINTIFFATLVASVYAMMQYMGFEPIWPKVLNPFGGRSVSTFGNPNFLSSYLVMVVPVALACFLVTANVAARKWYYVLALIAFAAELCTLTRSSWLGLGAGMMLFGLLLCVFERELVTKNKKTIIVTIMIFVAIGIFFPQSTVGGKNPTIIERLTEAARATKEKKNYGSVNQRQLIWSCAASMVLEKPILGKGWGCFELFYPFYQGKFLFLEPFREFRTHANNAHDEILEIWSQTGTLGFGTYLWFLASLYYYAVYLMRNLKGPQRIMVIGLSAAMAGMWVDNLLNVSLHFAVPGFLYWWFMGTLLSYGPKQEKIISTKSAIMRGLMIILLICGALVIARYTRSFLGEFHYFNGFKLSKQNNLQAAIPELESAHRYQRFEVNNNYELANCYARSGERDKALVMYMESLRANAGYDEIYFNLATVLMQKGLVDKAIPEYTQSLNINPLSWDGYNALGSIYMQDPARTGNSCVALFKQYVSLQPGNKDIWNNLGYLYTKTGRNDLALDAYKKAVEIDPDFDLARKNIEITLQRLGKRDRDYDEMNALIQQAEKAIVAKNWVAALPACQKFAERLPRSIKAHFYLANVYFTTGKLQEAVAEYTEALKIDPNNTTVRTNLGMAYAEMKQYNQAITELTTVVQHDPNNKIAQTRLDQLRAYMSQQH